MLVKVIVPIKFLFLSFQIIITGLILATMDLYPGSQTTGTGSFIAACALILVFTIGQIVFTIIGVNVYNVRVHFENSLMNGLACIFLLWFTLNNWDRLYLWLIWAFLWYINFQNSVIPLANQFGGLISMICHSNKLIFEKYRSDD